MIINPTSETGKKVLQYMQENPMTPNVFAKKVGIAQPTVRKLLTGVGSISIGVQFKIEKFLKEQNGK
jgi:plasmid maintenance system antidote protein VapI